MPDNRVLYRRIGMALYEVETALTSELCETDAAAYVEYELWVRSHDAPFGPAAMSFRLTLANEWAAPAGDFSPESHLRAWYLDCVEAFCHEVAKKGFEPGTVIPSWAVNCCAGKPTRHGKPTRFEHVHGCPRQSLSQPYCPYCGGVVGRQTHPADDSQLGLPYEGCGGPWHRWNKWLCPTCGRPAAPLLLWDPEPLEGQELAGMIFEELCMDAAHDDKGPVVI